MFVPRNSDWGEDQEQKLGSFHFWTDGFSLDMVDSTSNFRSGFRQNHVATSFDSQQKFLIINGYYEATYHATEDVIVTRGGSGQGSKFAI